MIQMYSSKTRPPWLSLIALACPIILSELGWMSMSVVDTIMVGRLNTEAIGAVGLGNAFFNAPALFGIGILLGLDTLVSQAYGRGDLDECHRWLSQGVYIAIGFAPVLMGILWMTPGSFPYLAMNPAVSHQTSEYLHVLSWSVLPLLLYAAFRRYLQGVKRVGPVTFALISANCINWIANWVLIYGLFGLPAMGVRGSALSTCLARLYMATVLIFAAWKNESRRGHRLFNHWPGLVFKRTHGLLRLGIPAAGQMVTEVGAFAAATVMAGRLNSVALAAHQIVLSCAAFTYMVPLGTSSAAAVAVGHAIGAGDVRRARQTGWLAITLGTVFMGFASVLFLAVPHVILRVYTNEETVISAGIPLLGLGAAFQIFDGVQVVATGCLRGLGQTSTSLLANVFGYWVLGLPLGYTFCFIDKKGVYGLWTGLTLALIFVAGILLMRWWKESMHLTVGSQP